MHIYRALPTVPGIPIVILEFALTLAVFALALGCGRAARPNFFSRLEHSFGQLARRRAVAVLVTGVAAVLLRLLILPISPIPHPSPVFRDDFSFLLAGETFASGRLTNPTPPMWTHFESFHITMKPTYMSMYFPAQGLVLAAGKLLFGHPWFGVLLSCGLMCAAITWMLQGWLPPGWALLGGMLSVLRLALFSYWIDTYMGGAVAAFGGALVLGAFPRIRRAFRTRDFLWMALGMAVLATSRPYEGMLVSLPAIIALCCYLARQPHPRASVLLKRIAPAVVVLLSTVAFMAYYDCRVFGNVLTPPYAANRATYAPAPHFLWQSPRPEPVYRHKIMRDFYIGEELRSFRESRTLVGFFEASTYKLVEGLLFYLGFALLVPVFMLPLVVRDRRTRFLLATGAVLLAGLAVETWFIPHYFAPFTAAFYAILVQCMRHLRVWRPGGRASGLFLVRAIPVTCSLLAVLCLFAPRLCVALPHEYAVVQGWYGARPLGIARTKVQTELENQLGTQLAIVRYSAKHDSLVEWVYNAADIDKSKVVWAREMDPASNLELIRYYKDRKVWLVEPDCNPPKVSPYPVEEMESGTHELAMIPKRSRARQ